MRAKPGRARRHAAEAQRLRGLPAPAGSPPADRDADGARRRERPDHGPRARRRRLRRQAVLAAGARRQGQVGAPTGRPAAPRRADRDGLDRSRPAFAFRHGRRARRGSDDARVRPARLPHAAPGSGLRPRRAARAGLGLHLRQHADRHGSRPAAAPQDRARSRAPRARDDRLGIRLPLRLMTTRLVATLLVLGALGIGATALFVDGSAGDALVLAAEAGGASVAVGLIVGLVLWALRRSSIASQLVVITLGTVGAVAAGALVSAQTMFAAERPYAALALVLVTSGTASVLIGLSLSARVRRESDSLARAARTLGTSAPALVFDRPETDELARLARELDLSARRLDESRAYAAQLDRSRRELVAWISHDLRTPLARIRAMVEALDDRVVTDSDEVTSFHERLRGDAGRLTGLVDELFELSRIDAGAPTLNFQELELADLIGPRRRVRPDRRGAGYPTSDRVACAAGRAGVDGPHRAGDLEPARQRHPVQPRRERRLGRHRPARRGGVRCHLRRLRRRVARGAGRDLRRRLVTPSRWVRRRWLLYRARACDRERSDRRPRRHSVGRG